MEKIRERPPGCLDCCGQFPEIREKPPVAPRWFRLLSCFFYIFTAVLALIALVPDLAGTALVVQVTEDISVPVAAFVAGVGIAQYLIECAWAYQNVVTLWNWTPYYVLQHHLAAVLLAIVMNLQLFFDAPLWLHLLQVHQSFRLVILSCGITGLNEALWVASTFFAKPEARQFEWMRTCLGMSCLVQNVLVCVPGLWYYCYFALWPLFKETGSVCALTQIFLNGVCQTLGFHLYLQVCVFMRLQFKKMCRLYQQDQEDKLMQTDEDEDHDEEETTALTMDDGTSQSQ